MAISPEVLAKQNGLRVVRGHGTGVPAPCTHCGTMTTAKSGACRACVNGYGLPDVRTLSTERIMSYVASMRAELKRRQDEITQALGVLP